MSASWELWLTDQYGQRMEVLSDVCQFGLSKVANDYGQFTVVLPPSYDITTFSPDQMIEFWRSADGTSEWIDNGIVRTFGDQDSQNGTKSVIVSGPTSNEILKRRIIAYPSGSTEASQDGYAGDIIRDEFALNFGATASDTDRDLVTPGYMQSESNISEGAYITKSFAWRNALAVFQDISLASRQAGVRLYFGLSPVDNGPKSKMQLRITTLQPGENRTYGTSRASYIGPEIGNINSAQISLNYEDEVSYVYAAGQGAGDLRTIEEIEDQSRSLYTIWNRREALMDGRRESSTDGLVALGNTALAEGRPYFRFSGSILETPDFRYGVDWRWGDRIAAEYAGIQVDVVILSVSFAVDGDGNESISARAEVLA